LLLAAAAPVNPTGRLLDLFDKACVASAGDRQVARGVLAARGLKPIPSAGAAKMLARPGLIYDAGGVAVLSFDDGTCGTMAEGVDAGQALAELAVRMKARGIEVSAVGSAPAGTAQLYRLEGPKGRLALMVDMRSVHGTTRVSMLAAPDGG
jgi:hypothetical protein